MENVMLACGISAPNLIELFYLFVKISTKSVWTGKEAGTRKPDTRRSKCGCSKAAISHYLKLRTQPPSHTCLVGRGYEMDTLRQNKMNLEFEMQSLGSCPGGRGEKVWSGMSSLI
ncbi:unnamed protein product [Coregonus sp. 'balchen']|nr:unnamed protein product [Coregonus sp. 'balchen']